MLKTVFLICTMFFSSVVAAHSAGDSVFTASDYEVVVLDSLNSPENDVFPVLHCDGNTLFFVSNRRGSTLIKMSFPKTASSDWWISSRKPDSTFSRPEVWGQAATFLNEGCGGFSIDCEQLYYTVCDFPKGYGGCDIYVIKRDSTGALVARNLGTNINSEHWEAQPTITPEGRLYFVSNRPAPSGARELPAGVSKGTFNIWYANYDWSNDTFGKAVFAGWVINTLGDETSPHYSMFDDALYFSSNGRKPNIGKADIYRTKLLPDDSFEAPQLIGEPFSSDSEDLGVTFSADGREAFVTSKRTNLRNQGGFDIFLLRKKKP